MQSGLEEKAVYCMYFQISRFAPEIFMCLTYANYDVMPATNFQSNMMKKDISANLDQNVNQFFSASFY